MTAEFESGSDFTLALTVAHAIDPFSGVDLLHPWPQTQNSAANKMESMDLEPLLR